MPAGKAPRAGRAVATGTRTRADQDPNWRQRTIQLAAATPPPGLSPDASAAATGTPTRADRDPSWRRRTIELAAATPLPPPPGLWLDASVATQTTRAQMGGAVTVTATAAGMDLDLGLGTLEACLAGAKCVNSNTGMSS